MYRHEYDHDLGHDFIGRTLKDCVGSPPPSLLDKRHWNETTNDYPFNANLVIDDMIARIREDPNDGTTITVVCPTECSTEALPHEMTYLDLLGTVATVYGETTSVCGAARNEGLLTDATDALIDVTIVSEALVQSISNRSLHMSREYFFLSSSSREMRVQTIAGASGYIDSFPPQSSKVCGK